MRILKTLMFCFIASLAILASLVFLYLFSGDEATTSGGFSRIFLSPKFSNNNYGFYSGHRSYYIAGLGKDALFLGNWMNPEHILRSNYMLTDTQHIALRIPHIDSMKRTAIRIEIDSPRLRVTEGLSSTVLDGDLEYNHLRKVRVGTYFDQCVKTSASSFVFRTYDTRSRIRKLVKVTKDGVEERSIDLEKQIDGYFCTDGMLLYDSSSSHLLYVYYYRNQFTALDENLNILYEGRTIDTIAHANIKVGSINSENKTVVLNQPIFVNFKSCVDNGRLYIYSTRKADNESEDIRDTKSTIDVYLVENGRYLCSFYVNNMMNESVTDFKVSGDNVVSLHNRYIQVSRFLLRHI